MSFFNKEETEKNLQYDDIAFTHFMLSISVVAICVTVFLIFKQLKHKNNQEIKILKESGLFVKQLQQYEKVQNKQIKNTSFYIKIIFLIASIILAAVLLNEISNHENQLIGFDPYQILQVQIDAPISKIKKSYRKLALLYHPDRNPNNPEAAAKFIRISKSYECLTDPQKKQNCAKFGNPDGASSFQVGIGLPKFIVSMDYQYIVLPVVFFVLLFLIPKMIINWNNNLKAKDENGLLIANYQYLYPLIKPQFTASYGFYLVASLRQLETKDRLTEQDKADFKQFINLTKIVDFNTVNGMTQSQTTVMFRLIKYMTNKQKNQQLSKVLPDLLNGLLQFSLVFARRMFDKKPLLNNEQWPINFIGINHVFMLLQFIRTFYNCSLCSPPGYLPFNHLDLTNQEMEISFKHPLKSIRQDLLVSDEKINEYLNFFPQNGRSYIRKQLKNLPLLSLQLKFMLGKQEVKEFSTQDFPQVYYRVKKLNDTNGYCFLKRFPYLKKERYYLMILYGINLIHFQQINLNGEKQFVNKFPYRQVFPKEMKFTAYLVSDCYYGLDIKTQFGVNVVQAKSEQANPIIIHKDDLNIEKQPKTFFQKMLSLQVQNPSDNELSDTEDEEPEVKKPKRQMMEQKEQKDQISSKDKL